jgi:hypothetical protein
LPALRLVHVTATPILDNHHIFAPSLSSTSHNVRVIVLRLPLEQGVNFDI